MIIGLLAKIRPALERHSAPVRLNGRHSIFRRILLGCLLVLLGVAAHGRAHADTLGTLIGIAATVLGEPALNDARPLIECLLNKGPASCVDVKGLAETEGKEVAKKFKPDDPLIQSAVEIIKAAYAEDWIKVLELTGTDVLVQVACKAGLSGGGPLKGFICGSLFKEVSHLAKPVLKQVLVAVKNPTPGNLFGLIAVVDPALACKVVPDFPGKDEICGPLGEVIKLAKDVAEGAAKAGKEVGEFLLETGEQLAKGIGGALEGACEGIGLCDDDSKKLMSANQYYKYRLFPLIHDRVVARLAKGQQDLGHDDATRQACLKYYGYDLLTGSLALAAAPQLKQLIAGGCDKIGKRLHDEADVLAKAFAAAPGPYFDISVKPLIPAFAVEGYGQNKVSGYSKFVTTVCVTNMRKSLPIVEPTKKGSLTAWSYTCNKVAATFKLAYDAEEKKLANSLQKLVTAGCFPPKGWTASQGIQLDCDSYTGYQQCLASLSAGAEKKHCSVNQQKADQKLAKDIVAALGPKRCQVIGTDVACTRPWKQEQCVALRAQVAGKSPVPSKVQCKQGPKGAVVAFAAMTKQAQDLVFALNGGIKKQTGMKTEKGEGLVIFVPPAADNCKATWDPLGITCKDPDVLAKSGQLLPGKSLPGCPPDSNKDGADALCYAGALSIKSGADQPLIGKGQVPTSELPKPAFTGGRPEQEIARGELPPTTGPQRLKPPTREASTPPLKMPPPGSVSVATAPVVASGLADLTHGPQMTIAGRTVSGAVVNIDASAAQSVNKNNGGLCEFAIRHSARNLGSTGAGAFDSVWTNNAVPGSFRRSWPPLGAGNTREETDLVNLKPGQNILSLTLDTLNRVNESNEQNNQFRIVVNVSGNCGPVAVAPQRGLAPALPPVVPQPPADQRQQQTPPPSGPRSLTPGR